MKTNLFDSGVGCSTCGDFTCEICRTEYNKGNDENEDYSGESIIYTDFAGIEICFNCFGKIEQEILYRIHDIIPWYKKIIEIKNKKLETEKQLIKDLLENK